MDAAVAATSTGVPPDGEPSARQDAAARWGLKLHFFIVVNLLGKDCPLGPNRVEPVSTRGNSLRRNPAKTSYNFGKWTIKKSIKSMT
jgi:hypothetical protein